MANSNYLLTFADVPFVEDSGQRVAFIESPGQEEPFPLGPERFSMAGGLYEELDKLLPFDQLKDYAPQEAFPGRSLSSIARALPSNNRPVPSLKIGQWYYPYGAGRWSVFRGLATSQQAKAMLAATQGKLLKNFTMKAQPGLPSQNIPQKPIPANYTLTSEMHLLSARPLADVGKQYNGLFLITLVDDRWFWQGNVCTIRINQNSTWDSVIDSLASSLGISLSLGSVIEPSYFQPEADSQLWCNGENAATLLDAVANNLGRVLVRNLDSTYELLTFSESATRAKENRGNVNTVIRTAGGDIFYSGNNSVAGNLRNNRNSVIDSSIIVQFPKYVNTDTPAPHFINTRYNNQRPSCAYEESLADLYTVEVPVSSGGPLVSGLVGVSGSNHAVKETAKALFSSEEAVNPDNMSGLRSLAMQVARNYYYGKALYALDEAYPGTLVWEPEGLHDIIWTYSSTQGKGGTRITKTEWNADVNSYQHSTPAISGYTNTPRGVGGPSLALNIKDTTEPDLSGVGLQPLTSGSTYVLIDPLEAVNLPLGGNWKGRVDGEDMLLGSGFDLMSGYYKIPILQRGIDGTLITQHGGNSGLFQIKPHANYGVNLLTFCSGMQVLPGQSYSGGIQEVRILPPIIGSGGIDIFQSGDIYNINYNFWNINNTTINNITNNTYNYGQSGSVGGSGNIINYFSGTQINFYGGDTFNFFGDTNFNGVSGTTIYINVRTELCDDVFLCWNTLTIAGARADNVVWPIKAGGHTQPVVRIITTTDNCEIGGFVPFGLGHTVWITNAGDKTFYLIDQNAGSAETNRFSLTTTVSSVAVPPNEGCMLWYDGTELRWKVIELVPTSGGGGGGSTPTENGNVSQGGNCVVSTTYSGTGLIKTLTRAGNYHITVNAQNTLDTPTLNATIELKLYNLTTASDVSDSFTAIQSQVVNVPTANIGSITKIVNVNSGDQIELQAQKTNSASTAEVGTATSMAYFSLF